MDQLIEFVTNNAILVGVWLAFLLMLFLYNQKLSGKSVSTNQATQLINREDAVVLDIRDRKEYKAGHIAGAINIPYADLKTRISELDKHKSVPIILVCKTGQTVSAASKMLLEKEFNAVRLSGGMMEWSSQNLPLIKK